MQKPRKKFTKNGTYMPDTGQLRSVSLSMAGAGFAVFFIAIAFAFYLNHHASTKYDMRTEYLLSTSRPCAVEILVDFDREPIDFILHAPDNNWYSTANFTEYEITDNQIRAILHTDLVGDWDIEYNIKSNNDMHIAVTQKNIDALYVANPGLNYDPVTGQVTLSFTPQFGDMTDTTTELTCQAYLTSDEQYQTHVLYDGIVALNNQITVSYQPTETIDPNASDWLLMINLAKADDLLGAQEYRQNYTAGPATIQGMFRAPEVQTSNQDNTAQPEN